MILTGNSNSWFIVIMIFMVVQPAGISQITHDFEDSLLNEWTQNEELRWEVSENSPLSGNYSLHHAYDNQSSGKDRISYPIHELKPDQGLVIWRFFIRHEYPPSSANNWSFFLMSDKDASEMYPGGEMNGFAAGVNYTGSSDLFGLWKIVDGEASVLLETDFNWEDNISASDIIGCEISRSVSGLWEMKIDTSTSFENLVPIGTVHDQWLPNCRHFGIYYEYSSRQDRKLWIDDIFINGTFVSDTLPPQIDSLLITSGNTATVKFSEPVLNNTVIDTLNYYVNNGIGNPFQVSILSSKKVLLEFKIPFVEEKEYNLRISRITDLSGNIMTENNISFIWYVPGAYDIVINEIMADPVPAVELPPLEYVELYNTTDYPANMNNWILTAGNNMYLIPDIELVAGGYMILCSEEDIDEFATYGDVAGLPSFPVLVNSGKTLTIQNNKDQIISMVIYSDRWYKDEYKKEGGWSLEQIDPLNPCGGETNWKASSDYRGGTPGYENSLKGDNADLISPALKGAVIEDGHKLHLFFTEPCDSISAMDRKIYNVDHDFGNPDSVQLVAPQYSDVLLIFERSFKQGYIYTLELTGNLYDCAGNSSEIDNSVSFGIPENPDSLDIIINEVLFDPLPEGVDFVEIYNNSLKIVDLENLKLATRNENTYELESVSSISEDPALFFPSEYLAVTTDITKLSKQYYFANPGTVLEVEEMPSFNNDNGRVIVTDKRLNIFDEFAYNEDMHFPLLNNKEGVSLERISFDGPANRESNWHSAAENAGFATPGYLNSQYSEDTNSEMEVWLSPEVFSPDNDGFDDFVTLHFNFRDPGNVVSVYVFDAKGRIVRHLVRNELLSVEGSVSWDGLDDVSQKAPMGIYLFYIELYNNKGNLKTFKKTCVLAHQL